MVFEIDSNIIKGRKIPSKILDIAQNLIEKKLPRSFIKWTELFGENVHINSAKGNFSTFKIFPKKKEDEIISITEGTNKLIEFGWPLDKDFVAFGDDGGENIFAFYTRHSDNSDYPVVMVSQDSKKPYVLISNNFEGFINTYLIIEILREKLDENQLLVKSEKFVNKYGPKMGSKFSRQLISWDWEYLSLKELNQRIRKLSRKEV